MEKHKRLFKGPTKLFNYGKEPIRDSVLSLRYFRQLNPVGSSYCSSLWSLKAFSGFLITETFRSSYGLRYSFKIV